MGRGPIVFSKRRGTSTEEVDALIDAGIFLQARDWISGRYYDWSHAEAGMSLATTAFATGTVYAEPIYIPRACTLDRIGVDVTVAGTAGATLRLGIYREDPATLYPGTLLLDAGTLAGDSTGAKEATISLAIASPGWHHLVFSVSANITVRSYSNVSCDYFGLTGPGDTTRLPVSRMTMAYGAYPATWTHASRGSTAPAVAVRMA